MTNRSSDNENNKIDLKLCTIFTKQNLVKMNKYICDKHIKTLSDNIITKNKIYIDKMERDKTKSLDIKKITIKNKSPLRYPGGKTRACKKLDTILNENFDITKFDTIVSPFFGGGSFEFHVQNNYKLNIIANDKFTPLYNFWNICKLNNNKLCKELYKKVNTIKKDDFTAIRKKIMGEDNPLIQSIMYFIINRCSFSGATLSGGFSFESSKKRFTKSSVDRVEKLDLSYFNIYNLDFEDFLAKNDNKKSLIFLDPPYYLEKGSKLYGNNGDMHESFSHEKLHACLLTKKNWFMTYNNCEYIKDLYKDYKIIDTNWSYGMNKSKESSEIVIIG
jgi:DNA adenine methylase